MVFPGIQKTPLVIMNAGELYFKQTKNGGEK